MSDIGDSGAENNALLLKSGQLFHRAWLMHTSPARDSEMHFLKKSRIYSPYRFANVYYVDARANKQWARRFVWFTARIYILRNEGRICSLLNLTAKIMIVVPLLYYCSSVMIRYVRISDYDINCRPGYCNRLQ